MKNTRELFRFNLKRIIDENGLKYEKVAELCGFSESFLKQILSGKSAYSPETIDDICAGLQCSPDELYKPESDKRPSREELLLSIRSRLPALNYNQIVTIDSAMADLIASNRLNAKTTVAD